MSAPTLNALQLRQLADAAASLRGPAGDPVYAVVVEEDGNPQINLQQGLANGPVPQDTVVEFDTDDQQPNRESVVVSVQSARMTGQTTLEQYDAVFWSEAAVEKFVLPYYASKSLWMAAHVLQKLSERWYGFVPGAPAPVQGAAASVDPEPVPFAVAHLPGSDYVGLTDPAAGVANDLYLLSTDATGKVVHQRLADLL